MVSFLDPKNIGTSEVSSSHGRMAIFLPETWKLLGGWKM